MIKTEHIHSFNVNTLIIDNEIKELFDKKINLFLTPIEIEENAVVGAIWDASGGPNMCPLCSSLHGQFFPVESGEFGRLEPGGVHPHCECMWRYVTARQRGVQKLIEEYRPVDKDLLAKWSSKIYTKAEIREMARRSESALIDFHKNLTKAEKEALDTYSGTSYKDMRLYMKGGAPERKALLREWGDEWYNKIKKDSDTILKLFSKYHDGQAKIAIHRSLGDLDEAFYNRLKAYKTGNTISIDKSMTSWTTDSKITDDFIGGTHRVKFSLRGGRTTTKELDVWRYSSQAHEKEVLVNTTNFKIVEVKEVIDKEAGTKTLNIILGEI